MSTPSLRTTIDDWRRFTKAASNVTPLVEPYLTVGYEIRSRTIPRRHYVIPVRTGSETEYLGVPAPSRVVWDVVVTATDHCVKTFETSVMDAAEWIQQQIEAHEVTHG